MRHRAIGKWRWHKKKQLTGWWETKWCKLWRFAKLMSLMLRFRRWFILSFAPSSTKLLFFRPSRRRLWRKSWILEQQRNLDFSGLRLRCSFNCDSVTHALSAFSSSNVRILQPKLIHNFFSHSRHRTVHFVSIRDTIFSFVGRRLYFQFPALREFKNLELPRNKRTTKAARERDSRLEARRKKNHIHFHPRIPLAENFCRRIFREKD